MSSIWLGLIFALAPTLPLALPALFSRYLFGSASPYSRVHFFDSESGIAVLRSNWTSWHLKSARPYHYRTTSAAKFRSVGSYGCRCVFSRFSRALCNMYLNVHTVCFMQFGVFGSRVLARYRFWSFHEVQTVQMTCPEDVLIDSLIVRGVYERFIACVPSTAFHTVHMLVGRGCVERYV